MPALAYIDHQPFVDLRTGIIVFGCSLGIGDQTVCFRNQAGIPLDRRYIFFECLYQLIVESGLQIQDALFGVQYLIFQLF